MLVADTYLGHRDDPAVDEQLTAGEAITVVLSDLERQRSRVRTESADGQDLGIVVGRDLADGDVLEAEDGTLVLVELASIEALALDFADSDVSPIAALEIGHALGNRHWDLAVRGSTALFPVTDDRTRMDTAIDGLVPEDVHTQYVTVSPTIFDDAAGPDHGHNHGGGDHSHSHGGGDHGHSHDDGNHGHSHDGGDHGHHGHDSNHTHDESRDDDRTHHGHDERTQSTTDTQPHSSGRQTTAEDSRK